MLEGALMLHKYTSHNLLARVKLSEVFLHLISSRKLFHGYMKWSYNGLCFFSGKWGVTHNMLDDLHNHWKRAEAVRIKCLGVPTLDMDNVCFHLEVIRHGVHEFDYLFPLFMSSEIFCSFRS